MKYKNIYIDPSIKKNTYLNSKAVHSNYDKESIKDSMSNIAKNNNNISISTRDTKDIKNNKQIKKFSFDDFQESLLSVPVVQVKSDISKDNKSVVKKESPVPVLQKITVKKESPVPVLQKTTVKKEIPVPVLQKTTVKKESPVPVLQKTVKKENTKSLDTKENTKSVVKKNKSAKKKTKKKNENKSSIRSKSNIFRSKRRAKSLVNPNQTTMDSFIRRKYVSQKSIPKTLKNIENNYSAKESYPKIKKKTQKQNKSKIDNYKEIPISIFNNGPSKKKHIGIQDTDTMRKILISRGFICNESRAPDHIIKDMFLISLKGNICIEKD